MTRYKIKWIAWDGSHSRVLGFVFATNEIAARLIGRREFGPFGNGQQIEAEIA